MDQKGERAPYPSIVREEQMNKEEEYFSCYLNSTELRQLKIVMHSVLSLFSVCNCVCI